MSENENTPPQPIPTGGRGLTLSELQHRHVLRQEEWCPDQKPDLSFRGNELGGECGEAQNVIKKLERERHGWRGSRDTVEHLAEELADVVHCAVLVAITAGVDIERAVISKFNSTSAKNGLITFIDADTDDAHLISAAPDLLTALRNLYLHLVATDEEGLIEHVEPMMAARAAMLKAEGNNTPPHPLPTGELGLSATTGNDRIVAELMADDPALTIAEAEALIREATAATEACPPCGERLGRGNS